MPEAKKIRVAVVGGGCAAMAAVHELTRPEQNGRFDVTVYQQGWRLGGKGASGRGENGRIEEHGLHIWMGCYENAFRLMRSVYGELARDPKQCPVADWRDAFFPSSHIGLAHHAAATDWTVWSTMFPPLPGEPGAPLLDDEKNPFTVRGYVVRLVEVMHSLYELAYGAAARAIAKEEITTPLGELLANTRRLTVLPVGALESIAGLIENQLRMLPALVATIATGAAATAAGDLARAALHALDSLRPTAPSDPSRQRAGEVLEITLAAVVGIVRDGLLLDPRGFERIDELDFIDWLRGHGLSEHAASSPFLNGLYSLMFAYEDGDCTRPRQAAGQALRGCMRMFFTYRGSFFWKMQAGMGDIVFAPLYEVLRRRGVRFEFFHRLTNVRLGKTPSDTPGHIAGLDFEVQADVVGGRSYEPLVDVHGLPSWPPGPDWTQLVDGAHLREERHAFESHWDRRHTRNRSLTLGDDFDFVVLAVGGAALPHVCAELVAKDERWRNLCANLGTVATQALQVWTRAPMSELGWHRGPVTMTAFVSPFDTWSDMSHLVPAERWPASSGISTVAYFCNVLDERDVAECLPTDEMHQARVNALVRRHSDRFLTSELPRLWPALAGETAPRLDAMYWVGNVNPTDRYVQCLPGTPKFRISPLDRAYDNLAIAGDWTDCGLSLGCVESAVMSGLLASHALSQFPPLEAIVGYDHP